MIWKVKVKKRTVRLEIINPSTELWLIRTIKYLEKKLSELEEYLELVKPLE